ncbi:MAG: hypothetical protein ABMA02_12495 [Saprospiraceae bacterium]
MPKQVTLTIAAFSSPKLNKDQQQFNNLVNRIRGIRIKIEQMKEDDLELRRLGEKLVKPEETKMLNIWRDWVMALHTSPFKSKLSQKAANKFPLVMIAEMTTLLESSVYAEDAELQEIYVEYEGSGRSYAEIQEEDEFLMKDMTAFMMNNLYGTDMNADDFDDPAVLKEKMAAYQAKFEEMKQSKTEKNAQGKRSAAQIAAEEKRRLAEETVKKSAKQIYVDLVRNFHPDQEQDETLRVEKTEIMKSVTAAYEANDYLRLIELQMSLLAGRDNAVAKFNQAQIRYFNKTLREQLNDLEQELYFASPEGNGNMYAMLYDQNRNRMMTNIERHTRHVQATQRSLQKNILLIKDGKMFKDFVRDYDLGDTFDDFPTSGF